MAKHRKMVAHPPRVRPRMKAIRRSVRREYERDIATLRRLLEEQTITSCLLRSKLTKERGVTLASHLRIWWKEGPCPRRWRLFLSTP